MPLPTIALTVRAAARGICPSGKQWVNVWHFRKTSGSIDAAALMALDAELFKLYNGPAYAGAGNRYLKFYWTTATLLQDATYTPLDGSSASTLVSWTGAGTDAGALIPAEVAYVLSFRTGLRGARHRGRVYIAGGDVNSLASGLILDTYRSGVVSNYAAFITAITAANWQHVVASYKFAQATTVTSVLMDAKPDVQRRRK